MAGAEIDIHDRSAACARGRAVPRDRGARVGVRADHRWSATRPGRGAAGHGAPFAGLAPCGDQPFVAVFTVASLPTVCWWRSRVSPSSDIYGVRPGRLYVSAGDHRPRLLRVRHRRRAATIYASPSPPSASGASSKADAPAAETTPTADRWWRSSRRPAADSRAGVAGRRCGRARARRVPLGLTVFTPARSRGAGISAPAVVDLPAVGAPAWSGPGRQGRRPRRAGRRRDA